MVVFYVFQNFIENFLDESLNNSKIIYIFALHLHNDTKKDEKNELNQKSDNCAPARRADYLPGCPRRDFAEHLLDHSEPLRQDLLGQQEG